MLYFSFFLIENSTGVILLLNELSQFFDFFVVVFFFLYAFFSNFEFLYTDFNYGIFTNTFLRQPYSGKMRKLILFLPQYVERILKTIEKPFNKQGERGSEYVLHEILD